MKASTLEQRFGTVWDTERPRRLCGWPKAACSWGWNSLLYSLLLLLRKWLFPAGLVGGAWSLPFPLGVGLLVETSGEEAEMTMSILQAGAETKPPVA